MDDHFRNAIMRSAESFIAEYDPNENRRIDNNTAKALVSKLGIINGRKECPICFDNSNSNKISILPCCGNEICQPCIIGTITQNTKDCPMCRSDLVEEIQKTRQTSNKPPRQKSSQIFKLIKYNPVGQKSSINGTTIKTRRYLIEPEGDNEERDPINIIYHNNSETNRRLFESDILGYYLDNAHSLSDEPKTWDNIRKQCRNFTNRNKEVEHVIPDNVVRPFYNKLKNTISSQIS